MTPADLPPLTKNQKRYLAKFQCAWCDHRLDRDGCSAIYGQCDTEAVNKRRSKCLANHKPRKP